jgi:hypothetical protein
MPETDMFGKPWPMQQALQQNLRTGAAPAGYDQKNWADPTMKSVKYDAGGFFNGKTKPSEIGGIVTGADFQKRFPGATFDGKDRVNFNGAMSDGTTGSPVYDIDVLMAADKGADASNGFWWGAPETNQGAKPPTSNTMPIVPGQQSDLMAQILEALQGQQAPDPQMLLQQQLAR